MIKFIKTFFFLSVLMFSTSAFSQNYNISFSFPAGGAGAISFNYPTPCIHCQMSSMTNFNANFQIAANTWNQTNIVAPISPTLYLEFNAITKQWYFDDSNPAVLVGATIITFNNAGGQVLSFTKGLVGAAGIAQLNAVPIVGNFTAINTPVAVASVPTLSEWILLLLIISLALIGFKLSKGQYNKP